MLNDSLPNEWVLIICLSAVFLGTIIFILSGLMKVKKNHVVIIERLGLFSGIYSSGFHYFAPFIYRRIATYKLFNSKKIIELENSQKIILSFNIDNVLKFHNSGHDIVGFIKKLEKEHTKLDVNLLKNELQKIGCAYKSIEKYIKK